MKRLSLRLALLLSLAVCLLAISRESLWIDEAFGAARAVQPAFAAWWESMKLLGGSELQMPLYMAWLWAWEKAFGSSEWALRAANIPWFLLAQFAFWLGFRRWPRLRAAGLLCAACHPLVWRYLNEARPYLMQYCGSCIVVSCMAALAAEEAPPVTAGWVWALGAGLVILSGSSALGLAWVGAAAVALFFLLWGRARPGRNLAGAIVAACAILAAMCALAAYFKWTVAYGGPTIGLGGGLKSFVFAFYELLGFAGMGPSRLAIAELFFPVFIPYLPVLLFMALCLAGTLAVGLRAFAKAAPRRVHLAAAAYAFLPPLVLAALAYKTEFRVLGRHLIPMTPIAILVVAAALVSLVEKKKLLPRLCAGLLMAFWLCSCLQLRFAPRHLRDDYRDAAQVAHAGLQRRQTVWWAASTIAGAYYGLPTGDNNVAAPGKAVAIWNPLPADLARMPVPDLVVFSKPTLFDHSGVLAAYLAGRHYRAVESLPAFVVWEK